MVIIRCTPQNRMKNSKIITPSEELRTRRHFFQSSAVGAAALFSTPGLFAETLLKTPRQTEGPYYPDKFPLDTDNDLIMLNDSLTPAIGEITYLSGQIIDTKGSPVKNAVVEIWQCDGKGSYLHSKGANPRNGRQRDNHFQGFGRFLTGSKGEYFFRTIKPVPYPGRTPHIHVIVKKGEKRLITTQCYIKGHEMNARDGVLRNIRDPKLKQLCMVDWKPITDSKTKEYTAHWDIIVGLTPADKA